MDYGFGAVGVSLAVAGEAAAVHAPAGWVGRAARDYERLAQHSETLIAWAAITLMTRRITRSKKTPASAASTPAQLTQAA